MTRGDIHKALSEGKTVVLSMNGDEVTADSNPKDYTFKRPSAWSIKEEPKMYCRFKRIVSGGGIVFTEYKEVGSVNYNYFARDPDHIPCTPKTFEEIE